MNDLKEVYFIHDFLIIKSYGSKYDLYKLVNIPSSPQSVGGQRDKLNVSKPGLDPWKKDE